MACKRTSGCERIRGTMGEWALRTVVDARHVGQLRHGADGSRHGALQYGRPCRLQYYACVNMSWCAGCVMREGVVLCGVCIESMPSRWRHAQ